MFPQITPFAIGSQAVDNDCFIATPPQSGMQIRPDETSAARDHYHWTAYTQWPMISHHRLAGECSMTERPKFFDDLAGVAGGAMSAFSGLRDETASLIKARVDEAIRKLDLVRREEFDVMGDLVSKLMAETEALAGRVANLEAQITGLKSEADRPSEPVGKDPDQADKTSH
jgi:BMFP domain-containing protein YqiC